MSSKKKKNGSVVKNEHRNTQGDNGKGTRVSGREKKKKKTGPSSKTNNTTLRVITQKGQQ